MRVVIAGSGSRGNGTLFETGRTRVLVDAGLSVRELRRRAEQARGPAERDLDALIVTHSHGDHVQHAARYAQLGVPVYGTHAALSALPLGESARAIGPKARFTIGDLSFQTLPLSHDVPQIAVLVEHEGERTALVTDLGRSSAALERALQGCSTVLLESNHCEELLATAPYPSFLKRRISSATGHLSNRQCADVLRALPDVKRVVLMHLSQKANSPRRARRVATEALAPGAKLLIADQDAPMLLASLRTGASQLAFGF
ncbi:MAG: MBL fold metallo-hydrolase [Myxococcota bacterium]